VVKVVVLLEASASMSRRVMRTAAWMKRTGRRRALLKTTSSEREFLLNGHLCRLFR
jgi:hypothetical protein